MAQESGLGNGERKERVKKREQRAVAGGSVLLTVLLWRWTLGTVSILPIWLAGWLGWRGRDS